MGKYVDSSLGPNEQVIHETRFHWIIFFFPSAFFTFWLHPLIERPSSEFAITNRRIVIKTGLFRRRTIELNIHQVESVNVDQSILGRMFDYGTVTIVGSGGTREVFANIERPLDFRRAYQRQL
jgi:uncharacterized membrane protein YdbT with pleckstrin-like domain